MIIKRLMSSVKCFCPFSSVCAFVCVYMFCLSACLVLTKNMWSSENSSELLVVCKHRQIFFIAWRNSTDG